MKIFVDDRITTKSSLEETNYQTLRLKPFQEKKKNIGICGRIMTQKGLARTPRRKQINFFGLKCIP